MYLMKTSKNNSNPMIIMFWSMPSCSMLKAYKAKSDTLNQAIKEEAQESFANETTFFIPGAIRVTKSHTH